VGCRELVILVDATADRFISKDSIANSFGDQVLPASFRVYLSFRGVGRQFLDDEGHWNPH
jgi:hypothetical protein